MKRRIALVMFVILLAFACPNVLANQEVVEGLVAYFDFNETGNTVTSRGSIEIKDAAVTNASLTTSGKARGALSANGARNKLDIGKSIGLSLDQKTGFTISVWVNSQTISAAAPSEQIIFNSFIGNGNTIKLYMQAGKVWIAGRSVVTDAWGSINTSYEFGASSLNRWKHIVGVVDYAGSSIKLYIDGALVETKTAVFSKPYYDRGTATTGKDDIILGDGTNDNQVFYGSIDEFMVFNRAISEQEVGVLYNAMEQPSVMTEGAVFSDENGAVANLTPNKSVNVSKFLINKGYTPKEFYLTALAYDKTTGILKNMVFSKKTVNGWAKDDISLDIIPGENQSIEAFVFKDIFALRPLGRLDTIE